MFSLVLGVIGLYGQGSLELKDGRVYYERVVSVDLTALDIYSSVKTWIGETYNDGEEVIVMDNKDAHTIIGSGVVSTSINGRVSKKKTMPVAVDFHYKLKVEGKENKYRVTISNVDQVVPQGRMSIEDHWDADLYKGKTHLMNDLSVTCKDLHNHFTGLLSSLEAALSDDSDW